jgi:hypothetical protein
MAELRIIGLVRLMRWARAQLDMGIHPDQAESFRATIRQAIRQVDGLLERAKTPASRLPQPSFHAYQFLKGVELDRLPPPTEAKRRANTPIGLYTSLQDEMLARLPDYRAGKTAEVTAELRSQVGSAAQAVEAACSRRGIRLQDLPAPTRRAALWLDYLKDPQALALHLQGLERLERFARQAVKGKIPVRVALANPAALYRMDNNGRSLALTVHEGFAGAPDEVLEALAGITLSRRSARRSQVIRAYAAGEEFLQISRKLAAGSKDGHPAAAGKDVERLVEAFERINREYFGGSLAQPALAWSRGLTYREFGQYQPASDRVSISRSLAAPSVPGYVLDFVMYHELLHKKLGVKIVGKRHYAHTAEFHREEKRFPRYEEAKTCMNELSRKLAPMKKRRTTR